MARRWRQGQDKSDIDFIYRLAVVVNLLATDMLLHIFSLRFTFMLLWGQFRGFLSHANFVYKQFQTFFLQEHDMKNSE